MWRPRAAEATKAREPFYLMHFNTAFSKTLCYNNTEFKNVFCSNRLKKTTKSYFSTSAHHFQKQIQYPSAIRGIQSSWQPQFNLNLEPPSKTVARKAIKQVQILIWYFSWILTLPWHAAQIFSKVIKTKMFQELWKHFGDSNKVKVKVKTIFWILIQCI